MKPKIGLTASTATADPADHREALLDEALQETFPASDPIAVSLDGTVRRAPDPNFDPQDPDTPWQKRGRIARGARTTAPARGLGRGARRNDRAGSGK